MLVESCEISLTAECRSSSNFEADVVAVWCRRSPERTFQLRPWRRSVASLSTDDRPCSQSPGWTRFPPGNVRHWAGLQLKIQIIQVSVAVACQTTATQTPTWCSICPRLHIDRRRSPPTLDARRTPLRRRTARRRSQPLSWTSTSATWMTCGGWTSWYDVVRTSATCSAGDATRRNDRWSDSCDLLSTFSHRA